MFPFFFFFLVVVVGIGGKLSIRWNVRLEVKPEEEEMNLMCYLVEVVLPPFYKTKTTKKKK